MRSDQGHTYNYRYGSDCITDTEKGLEKNKIVRKTKTKQNHIQFFLIFKNSFSSKVIVSNLYLLSNSILLCSGTQVYERNVSFLLAFCGPCRFLHAYNIICFVIIWFQAADFYFSSWGSCLVETGMTFPLKDTYYSLSKIWILSKQCHIWQVALFLKPLCLVCC